MSLEGSSEVIANKWVQYPLVWRLQLQLYPWKPTSVLLTSPVTVQPVTERHRLTQKQKTRYRKKENIIIISVLIPDLLQTRWTGVWNSACPIKHVAPNVYHLYTVALISINEYTLLHVLVKQQTKLTNVFWSSGCASVQPGIDCHVYGGSKASKLWNEIWDSWFLPTY